MSSLWLWLWFSCLVIQCELTPMANEHILSFSSKDEQKRLSLIASVKSLTECQILKSPHTIDRPIDVFCEGEQPVQHLQKAYPDLKVIVSGQEMLINEKMPTLLRSEPTMDFKHYPRYDTIMRYLDNLAAENPDLVTLSDMGQTHEERRLVLLKIGDSPQGDKTRAVWIDSGIHAREWIAPATGLYAVDRIVKAFNDVKYNRKNRDSLTSVDWYIMPILNPDGYEYSHMANRMWRKNRSPASGSDCFGVDLNRNWDCKGYGVGASEDPCSDIYEGPSRSSEPEVRAAISALDQHKDVIRAAISLHSYGRTWLTPWGYKTELPLDNDKMLKLGKEVTDRMKSVNGNSYEYGPASIKYYTAGGASDDFSKGKEGIPYVATLELAPKTSSDGGFVLSPKHISEAGEEFMAALEVVSLRASQEDLGIDPYFRKEQARNQ